MLIIMCLSDHNVPVRQQCNDDDDFSYADFIANGNQTQQCGTKYAVIFFLGYFLMVPLIFLNLFIAIILEGFE